MKYILILVLLFLSIQCFSQKGSSVTSIKKLRRAANTEQILGSFLMLGGSASIGVAGVIYIFKAAVGGVMTSTYGGDPQIDHSAEKILLFSGIAATGAGIFLVIDAGKARKIKINSTAMRVNSITSINYLPGISLSISIR